MTALLIISISLNIFLGIKIFLKYLKNELHSSLPEDETDSREPFNGFIESCVYRANKESYKHIVFKKEGADIFMYFKDGDTLTEVLRQPLSTWNNYLIKFKSLTEVNGVFKETLNGQHIDVEIQKDEINLKLV